MPTTRASGKAVPMRVFGRRFRRTKNARAGLYASVSTHDQQTLPRQNRHAGFATSRGWTITPEVRSASGASARELRRPRRRDIDVVVVWRLE